MPGRSKNSDQYRYGFNDQEKDKEWLGGAISYKFRVHDPRLGRFLSVDPLAPSYPWNSTFAFAENRVIDGVELEGRQWQSIVLNALRGGRATRQPTQQQIARDPIRNTAGAIRLQRAAEGARAIQQMKSRYTSIKDWVESQATTVTKPPVTDVSITSEGMNVEQRGIVTESFDAISIGRAAVEGMSSPSLEAEDYIRVTPKAGEDVQGQAIMRMDEDAKHREELRNLHKERRAAEKDYEQVKKDSEELSKDLWGRKDYDEQQKHEFNRTIIQGSKKQFSKALQKIQDAIGVLKKKLKKSYRDRHGDHHKH
ncbi:MAG: hypothetical protein MK212_19820, partial [Saprospiraceae bacterium]|nr:hypothetical protein [Saprospiraceae bacterium]